MTREYADDNGVTVKVCITCDHMPVDGEFSPYCGETCQSADATEVYSYEWADRWDINSER